MRRTLAAIDVGSTKICTIVAQVRPPDQLNILGVGTVPSKGLDRGVVVNIDDAVQSIAASVEKAERVSGYRIDTAFVGIAGRHISSLNSRGVVAVQRPDQEIARTDVARAVEAAQAVAIPTQREIVHVIPRTYVVDGNEGIRDPIGMSGFRLEVETHIVTGEVMAIQNLIKSVQRAGVEIDDLVLQPLASGEAVLTSEDKERGVVLVDIGGTTTDIAVYAQGGVWHTGVIPLGGSTFTSDIVYVLHTPHDTAEYLKLRYGSAVALADDPAGDELIDADTHVAGERQQIERRLLTDILQARAEELVELVYSDWQRSGYDGRLNGGLVITGGGAQLARLDELMRDMLGKPVRVGIPTGITGLTDALDSPPYATAIGLLRWGMAQGVVSADGTYSEYERSSRGKSGMVEKLKTWLREFLP